MQQDTSLERLLPSSNDSTSFLLFSTNFLLLQLLSLHLPQMILQSNALWLGGDGIGESLIPNQSPVSAGSTVHLSSPFCSLEPRYKTEMHAHCTGVIGSQSCWGRFTWDPEVQSLQGLPGSYSSNSPPPALPNYMVLSLAKFLRHYHLYLAMLATKL